MDEATIKFAKAARTADVAMFYYSGHALQFAGVNYLAPIDAGLTDEADLRRMVRVDEIVSDLQQAKNLRILVLDSCRNNPLAEQLKRSIGTTRAIPLQRGLARIDTPQGMIVSYSTQAGSTAEDGDGRNSPYTESFLRFIGEKEEIGTIFRRISSDVYEKTKHIQLPELSLSLTGEFYFNGRLEVATAPGPSPVNIGGTVSFNEALEPPESQTYIVVDDNVLARDKPNSHAHGLFRVSLKEEMRAVGQYVPKDANYFGERWIRVTNSKGQDGFLEVKGLRTPNQFGTWNDWEERRQSLASYFDQANKNANGPFARFSGVYCQGKCMEPIDAHDMGHMNLGIATQNRYLFWFEGDTVYKIAVINPKLGPFKGKIGEKSSVISFNSSEMPYKGVKNLQSYKVTWENGATETIAIDNHALFFLQKNSKGDTGWGYMTKEVASQYHILNQLLVWLRDEGSLSAKAR